MKKQEAKDLADVIRELSLSKRETADTINSALRGYASELRSTQKLWKKGNKSVLIKAGLALIAFPDPLISDIIGSAMVAVGLIQVKMRNSALHVEDLHETFKKVVKELGSIKRSVV